MITTTPTPEPPIPKYYCERCVLFNDNKHHYHHERDINWSFKFLISEKGSNPPKHRISTFLSKKIDIDSAIINPHLGFFDDSGELNGGVGIAIDSTGMYALSTNQYPNGVGINSIIPNSLIVRDTTGVIYNQPLSGMYENFDINSNGEYTLRFRYINKTEISIEIKNGNFYEKLLRIPIETNFQNDDSAYPYFCYTSPLSSGGNFRLQNFHVQGDTSEPTFE